MASVGKMCVCGWGVGGGEGANWSLNDRLNTTKK